MHSFPQYTLGTCYYDKCTKEFVRTKSLALTHTGRITSIKRILSGFERVIQLGPSLTLAQLTLSKQNVSPACPLL